MTSPRRGRLEIDRIKRQLDSTFARINTIDVGELELRSDFSRYLCVLVSGYIEKSVQELAHQLARRSSATPVARYVGEQISWFQNARADKLLNLVGSFDPDWRDTLERDFGDELAAVNSIVGNRHQIAHGGTASVSYAGIKEYYEQVQRLISYLEDKFDPI